MDLFLELFIRKKNLEISVFRKMAEQLRGVSVILISHIARVNISPKPCKAKFFVNFLHKLYQKYVK